MSTLNTRTAGKSQGMASQSLRSHLPRTTTSESGGWGVGTGTRELGSALGSEESELRSVEERSLCLARSGHLSLHGVPGSHLRGQNRKFCWRSWEENLLVPKALKFRTCPLPRFLSTKQPGLRLTGKEMRCALGSLPLI